MVENHSKSVKAAKGTMAESVTVEKDESRS